jgi:mono/diheme cytochrome c family protein
MRRGRLRLAGAALGAALLTAACGDSVRNEAAGGTASETISGTDAAGADSLAAPDTAPPTASPDTSSQTTRDTSVRPAGTGQPATKRPTPEEPTPKADTAPKTDTAATATDTASRSPKPSPPAGGGGAAAKPGKVTQVEYTGWKQYEVNCARCHGEYGLGSTIAPSLYHSFKTGAVDSAEYQRVVHGSRTVKGMPNWRGVLSEEYLHAIYKYLEGRGAGRIAAGRPTPEG